MEVLRVCIMGMTMNRAVSFTSEGELRMGHTYVTCIDKKWNS